jgi:hypothetical protein
LTPERRPLALNTPTVFNASLNFRLNWEGNFRSLEDHAKRTLRNPEIMASSADEVVSKLRADPEAVRQFRDAYGREPDVAALLDAIRPTSALVTPGSRFDRWLAGDAAAITPEELSGYQLFKSLAASLATKASMWAATSSNGTAFSIHWALRSPYWFASPACVTWRPRAVFPRWQRAYAVGGGQEWASPSSTAC